MSHLSTYHLGLSLLLWTLQLFLEILEFWFYTLLLMHYTSPFCTNLQLLDIDDNQWIICHYDDPVFRSRSYRASKIIQEHNAEIMPMQDFITAFASKYKETLNEKMIEAMKHAVEVSVSTLVVDP